MEEIITRVKKYTINAVVKSYGVRGLPGKSAYEIARTEGFEGTEEEWLDSLKGSPGPEGPKGDKGDIGETGPKGDKGDTGEKGIPGEKGEKGDQGLVGPPGETGPKGEDGDPFTYDMFTPEQLESLTGPKGDKGDAGEKGDTGNPGLIVSDVEPTDPDIAVWVNPIGDGEPIDYGKLSNLPKLNNVELKGNKTLNDINVYSKDEIDDMIGTIETLLSEV